MNNKSSPSRSEPQALLSRSWKRFIGVAMLILTIGLSSCQAALTGMGW
ncbi:MAG: hypothetical protein AAF402_12390 [Pseudomonadota bacterium]